MKKCFTKIHIKIHINFLSTVLTGLIIILLMSSPAAAGEFPDTTNSWARIDIAHLTIIGVCDGYEDGLFKPYESINRAEFTKLVVTAMECEDEASRLKGGISTYSDVDFSHWAKPYIQIASEMGLVEGNGTIFDPEKNINREEAAVILSRALEIKENDVDEKLPFNDNNKISDWAKDSIRKVYYEGLVNGYPDGSFRPGDPLNRAEAVVMVSRLMDRQGLSYQFNGILKEADSNSASININGETRGFTIAEDAILIDRNRIVNTLKDVINTRINFNLNNNGEIVFAQLSYEDKYLNLNVSQLEGISLNTFNSVKTDPEITNELIIAQNRWQETNVLSIKQPGLSLEITKNLTKVDELASEYGLSGKGVVIAIIDSGIDALHQDLQSTTSNSRKILDWVNFTTEGKVNTPYTANDTGENILKTQFGNINLPNISSQSGQFRYGFWQEEWIFSTQEMDFTANGITDDKIFVLLVDSREAGVYDTVFVDSNSNLSLLDEAPLHIYRDYKYSYGSFPASDTLPHGFSFVLTDIAADGSMVSFGYDSNGHGTHVAGIAAANGKIQGVAPDAQLIAIKVVDSSGITNIDNIIKGVKYAVEQGANVVNISLGQYLQDGKELEYFNEVINELAGEKAVFVAASGNAGPEIASLATPGNVDNVISVGAFVSPDMWKVDYGWETQADGLWYFSSNGPSKDGAWKPDLIAPGSTVSTYPGWKGNKYVLDEGTSMAAPFVSGVSALLMEGMWVNGKPVNSFMIKRALADGARPLEGPALIEQGHGLVDALSSWEYLQGSRGLARSDLLDTKAGLFGEEKGIYARGLIPGISTMEATNRGKESIFINWESNVDWLKPEQNQTQIAPGSKRTVNILYYIPEQPGLYNGLLEGHVENLPYNKVEFLNTLVVPIELDDNQEYLDYSSLEAGQIKRYYFEVPEKADLLSIKLKVLGIMRNLQGRARVHIFDPLGNEYEVSNYAGVAPDGLEAKREVEVIADKPDAGIWGVVVYSSATLDLYDLEKSDYVLTAKLQAPEAEKDHYIEGDIIIGCAYPRDKGVPETILLNIRDKDNLPYNGRLLINDRFYEVRDGKVEIFGQLEHNLLDLTIQRVM